MTQPRSGSIWDHSSHIPNLDSTFLFIFFCYTLNVCAPFPQVLIPNAMVFGGKAFGRYLGHEGRTLLSDISALIKEASSLPSFKGTTERQLTMNQEVRFYQTLNLDSVQLSPLDFQLPRL